VLTQISIGRRRLPGRQAGYAVASSNFW
jgi:hypothetical protein